MSTSGARTASHAGSWYSGDRRELASQLAGWLQDAASEMANEFPRGRARAIIAPHAGYSYSGPTAAFAYLALQQSAKEIDRVVLLGPSHHVGMSNCALPSVRTYCTPLGDIQIDIDAVDAIEASGNTEGLFTRMSRPVDEDEHSLEMHLPYIHHIMSQHNPSYRLVPIMVGSTSAATEAAVARALASLFADARTFFVVSSDFCHWGSRFGFTRYDEADGAIHESIERLDRRGMALVEAQGAHAFREYLRATKNTICGRHPICVLLELLESSAQLTLLRTRFVRYAQSSPCKKPRDSSVSYASAVVTLAVDEGDDGEVGTRTKKKQKKRRNGETGK